MVLPAEESAVWSAMISGKTRSGCRYSVVTQPLVAVAAGVSCTYWETRCLSNRLEVAACLHWASDPIKSLYKDGTDSLLPFVFGFCSLEDGKTRSLVGLTQENWSRVS